MEPDSSSFQEIFASASLLVLNHAWVMFMSFRHTCLSSWILYFKTFFSLFLYAPIDMLVQLTQIELDGDLEQDFNKLRMTLGEKS
jgi:hypothetical protein